ncbi:beta-N-acetylglucosaminidase domain-containing protein [Clostridium sp. B9]|uniref:beta-N-acetylglucosaminidase domain-containing protein n=1 Tax=Clostridium sp. B9 TaxID=3423224 RepID=UPI003D2ED862
MIRSDFRKKITMCLASVMALNLGMTISVRADEVLEKEIKENDITKEVSIYPAPQELTVGENKIILDNSVNIVGGDLADTYAYELLKNVLTDCAITINETPIEGATTIYIGEAEDNIEGMDSVLNELSIDKESVTKNDGYILAVDEDEAGDRIVIRGNDETGTFYGVQSLKQIINKDEDVSINEVVVKDEPTFKLRAVVEGFYGTPWSQEERLDQIKMYGEYKMNAYIYAPKSDPYHREKWREPYPVSELDRMGELIQTANENKVDFVFAISPGLDIRFEGEEGEADFQALINKAEALYEMGVRSFSILWDDIENHNGVQQAEVLNRFNEEFIKAKEDVKPLITVPVQYWGSSMFDGDNVKEYTRDFAATLDKDIEVMWTGNDVIPPNGVSLEDAKKVSDVYEREMMLWWNYPVNDYKEDKMALGPIYDLDKNLDQEVSGFIVNPMRFAEASKISTLTGADYGWNTVSYESESSWDKAIEIIAGEMKEEFKIFANHSTRLDTGRPDSPEIQNNITTLWEKWENGQSVEVEIEKLEDEFSKMVEVPGKLRENLDNEKLLSQLDSHLTKFEIYGKAGLNAIEILENILDGDMEDFWSNNFEGIKYLRDLDGIEATIANNVVDPFIRKVHEVGNDYFNKETTILEDKVYSYKSIGNIKDHKYSEWFISEQTHVPEYMFDDKDNTGFWSAENVKKDEYVGFDLGAVEEIKDVYLLMGRNNKDAEVITNGVIEYSEDGENWTELLVNNGAKEVVKETSIKARYIRYRAIEDSENRLYVREFKVNTGKSEEKLVGSLKVEGTTITKGAKEEHQTVSLGNINKVSFEEGDSIGVSINDVNNVLGFEVLGEINSDSFVLESSFDNIEWEEVGSGTSFNSEIPVVGKYFRIRAKEKTEANIEEIKVVIEGHTSGSITTNRRISTNPNIHPDFIIDNDYGSSFVCSDTIKKDDFVQLDLGKVKHIRDINLVQGPGGDYIDGDIEYSVDGETWTKVGEVEGTDTLIKDLDLEAQYIRVLSKGYKDRWSRVREFTVNTTVEEYETKASSVGTYTDRSENVRDNNLNTAYIPEGEIKSGDYLLRRIFNDKLVSKITVAQSTDNLSGAKVIGKTVNGETLELGTLDKGLNEFELENPRQLVSVKLLWEKNAGKVEVFELKPTFVSLEHVIDEIREEINRGKDALIEFNDKNNDEREELEEAIKHLEGLIKGNASHDEIVRNYEKLGEKIDNFIASEDEEDDTCEPDGDGNGGSEGDGNGDGNDNGGSEGDGNGDGNDNEGSGGDDNSGDDNGEDNENGNLPNTGSPIGTEGLMLMGAALATVGGITLKKRKK